MSVFTPVIRLPPKRKPSLARSHSNNSSSTTHYSNYDSPDPKEFLVSDTLFLSKLPDKVRESDIRTLLQHCMPIEIVLDREKDIGQLRFSHPKYADRAYSLYNGFTFTNSAKLELQMYQDKRLDPDATAVLLEINGLPEYFDDNKLYDVFRPFGPLNLCKCVMKDGAFRGTAFVQFFSQHSSDDAETHLHGHLLDGHKLSVVPFMPSKPYAQQQQQQQKREEILEEPQQTVDIMNLYIKNLEPHITNQDLNQAFRKFGRIISARVMTNPATGQSKGYGFVSFGKSEEAAAALQEMNGAILGNRPLTVAYHEPRKGRGNTNNHSNNSSSNNTPIPNYQHPQNVNKQMNENNYYNYNSMALPPPQQQKQQQPYYIPDQRSMNLSSTTPINGLGIDNVDELGINMNLRDLSIGQKPVAMHAATINLPARKVSDAPHINSSPNSGTSTGKSLISLASGLSVQPPPSMPHPVINYGHNGRPTLRRRGSLESVMTESSANIQRIKLEDAVRHCGDYGKATGDIVDMLLTLKRKERSLCLFNPDFLRDKVQLALEALATCNETDSEEEDEDVDVEMEFTMRKMPSNKKSSVMMLPSPTHQQPYYNPATTTTTSPIQREHNVSPPFIQPVKESKAIPIIAPPSTIIKAPSTKTASLTKENLMNNSKKTPEPSSTPPISSSANKEIEELLVSLEGKPIHERKQLLGDKLFPLVKSTGTKQAPKVTIYLLDTVDLHELANIMYDTPSLKIRVEEAFESLQQQQQ